MNSKYSHVVWDWNGTLLDDASLCVSIINQMLGKRGLPPVSADFYQAVIEFPVLLYYRKLGFDFDAEPFEQISDDFVSRYAEGWRQCSLQKNACETLARIGQAGIGQSVLSASMTGHLMEQLMYFDIDSKLDAITGADNHHGSGKLNIAKAHLTALGADPKQVVFIGDTQHDAEVAAEVGSSCVLVSYGHYGHDRLGHLGWPVADSMKEVLNYIL